MSKEGPNGQMYSFDEYKMYYESTEKVTDRRLATNTWNYGLCVALMVAIAGLASWASSRIDLRLIMLLAILVLSGVGSLLCALWTGQIRDFKDLNGAKFAILNEMAPRLQFGTDSTLVSATPFARDWDALKTREATREVSTMQIVALRSSNAEFLVPTAFRWLFILIMVTAIVIVVINWAILTSSIFDFKQSGGPIPPITTVPVKP
jgi:hypothetical protein